MASRELAEKVASIVFELDDPTEVEPDEKAIEMVAEYFELCDYGVADIEAVEDQSDASSEVYLLYYMLKLLAAEDKIRYVEEEEGNG